MKYKSICSPGVIIDFYYENEKQFINLIKDVIKYTGAEIDNSLIEDFNWEQIRKILEDYFIDLPLEELNDLFYEPEINENIDLLDIRYNNCDWYIYDDTYIKFNDKVFMEVQEGEIEEKDYTNLFIIDIVSGCIDENSNFDVEDFKYRYFDDAVGMDEEEYKKFVEDYEDFVSKFKNLFESRNHNKIFVVYNRSNNFQ